MAVVVSYINQHLTEPIRLADLAAVAGCSINQLGRLFQRAFQQTPVAYILQCRLQIAAERLLTSRQRITTIAFECGFNDGNYFSKQFKKHFAQSPRDYRAHRDRA